MRRRKAEGFFGPLSAALRMTKWSRRHKR